MMPAAKSMVVFSPAQFGSHHEDRRRVRRCPSPTIAASAVAATTETSSQRARAIQPTRRHREIDECGANAAGVHQVPRG